MNKTNHLSSRRNFLKSATVAAGGMAFFPMRIMAGPFNTKELAGAIPIDKKLNPQWVKSLYERGMPTIYKGNDLKYIGMPIGGVFAGQLYLGGDGKLWRWDIFNNSVATGADHYAFPPIPNYIVDQGFSIKIGEQSYTLDKDGFSDVSFKGQYPIGEISYKDSQIPVEVKLEAYSPFVPLNSDDSGLPATIMQFTVKNASDKTVDATLSGLLENAVCLNHRHLNGKSVNKAIASNGYTFLNYTAEQEISNVKPRSEILFEDWNKTEYTDWTVQGTAFGTGPIKKSDIPEYQGDVGGDTERVVNSHATAPGTDVAVKDNATGKLTSAPFTIERRFINAYIGGGSHKGKTCINLIVDNEVVLSLTGKNSNHMELRSFSVRNFENKEAHIEIVDAQQGSWANIGVGKITFSDVEAENIEFENLSDYGSMGLALLGNPADQLENSDTTAPLSKKLISTIGRNIALAPGEEKTVSFILTWFFPNVSNGAIGTGRYYASKFDSASSVANYVASNFDRLSSQTKLWRDTWYDSSLPFWFLDRTFLNISTAATSTCYRYTNRRMWAWEGVGCCAGTCTHVWHYAQALARIFPDIERDMRERVDLNISLNTDTGVSGFRAENDRSFAVDGQSGTILRIFREHQMTIDNSFLERNWDHIKLMFKPLFALDPNSDGVLEGGQMNTLDRPWYGKIAWLSSIYLAALRAGEAMASEMRDNEFANKCKSIIEKGSKEIDEQLFNSEYYYQIGQQGNTNQVGSYDGCEIDQVLGQSWVFQVGLDRVLPEENTKKALESLWKYNFAIDAGGYRNDRNAGRVYAMEGEAGLLMCSWPKGDSKRVKVSYDYYFNECMTGFEYQVAGHMIWEGILEKGLAVTRAIHDRYHASKRNPWNEVECGDHYARAMANHGVFTAASGFQYHGPKGIIGFAPKITPENFKAAFTSAEGWGLFTQNRTDGNQRSKIQMKYGQLKMKTLKLDLGEDIDTNSVKVTLKSGDNTIPQTHELNGAKLFITIDGIPVVIPENSDVEAEVTFKKHTSTSLLDDNKMGIYPNPTSGEITISCRQSPAVITVFDSNENQLLVQTVTEEITHVDFSGYAKGIYLVTAQNGLYSNSEKLILS